MELIYSSDCPDSLKDAFETLIDIKKTLYNTIVTLLVEGECSYLNSNDLYGYPYDYHLYSKDSLDPDVQVLNNLLEKVEETFQKLKNLNGID